MSSLSMKRYSPDILRFGEAERRLQFKIHNSQYIIGLRFLIHNSKFKIGLRADLLFFPLLSSLFPLHSYLFNEFLCIHILNVFVSINKIRAS